ncbi:MAG: DNA gyrase subunit A [Clostridia bacterium]|nr:DNA gyrase subunit A [Clostridia bacterium]
MEDNEKKINPNNEETEEVDSQFAGGGKIVPCVLETEVKRSFMAYSMAVIINRALPDVRDGLKPVHRRILYGMDELGAQPDKPTRKSARIVGEVMGKYHPHGDSSIYDAMVRLAQDFNMRYPLVYGQGNFGSIDGDSAAANRYTEARLAKLSTEMLADIEKNTVDFYPNFDETLMQPSVMPARFPNLLVNGTNGIAVGMATNIPPHNLGEVIDAYIAMLDNEEISVEELMNYIKGPDFPTGGTIMGTSGIRQAYRTGRGKIIVRAKTQVEDMPHDKQRIVVTEIPYGENKARLVESIAECVKEKRVEGITALRDESNRLGIKIVIELKRDTNATVVLNQLYKHTHLQTTYGAIMLALVDNEPKVLNLREMLMHYMKHQEEVVTRRTIYDLEKAKERMHILLGLLKALDCIDDIIALLKSSENGAVAKQRLMAEFDFSEKQSQAILDMRLQRLTGLEREKLQNEHDELLKRIEFYNSVLSDKNVLIGILKEEITAIRNKYADERRTNIELVFDSADIDLDDIIQEEDMVVTLTRMGYIKRLSTDTYTSQRRGGRGIVGQTTREEDFVERMFVTTTHKQIMFFTNKGRAFRMKCYMIPEAGRAAKGTAIINLLQLQEGEKVTMATPVEDNEKYLVLATKFGVIKKTPLTEFENIRKNGLIAQNLPDGDELVGALLTSGDDEIIIATRFGKAVRFSEGDVRSMGRTATGVRSMNLAEGDEIISVQKVSDGKYVLVISENGMGKLTEKEEYPAHKRGGKGVMAMNITDKTGYLSCLRMCNGDEDLMLIRSDGTVMRTSLTQVNVISRNTQGVRMMKIPDGTKVASVALAEPEDVTEDIETTENTEN